MGFGEEASPSFRGNSESFERHRGRAPLELRGKRSWERGFPLSKTLPNIAKQNFKPCHNLFCFLAKAFCL